MPGDIRRISAFACVLIVLLRLSIGWQLLYEGLWKIDTLDTAKPWTSEGYLRNAQGPFREPFRNLTGDPDDLDWLSYDKVVQRWDDWQQRFINHVPNLSDAQRRRIDLMLNGPEEFYSDPILAELPAGIEPEDLKVRQINVNKKLQPMVRYDAENKRLVVNGRWHLLPQERDELLDLVNKQQGVTIADEDPTEGDPQDPPAPNLDDVPQDVRDAAEPEETTTETSDAVTPDRETSDAGAAADALKPANAATDADGAADESAPPVEAATAAAETDAVADDATEAAAPMDDAERTRQLELAEVFRQAVRSLYLRSSRLSQKERLAVLLKVDPERAGVILRESSGEVIEERLGEIELYKQRLKQYNERRARAQQDFQYAHLDKQWNELQQMRSRLVGPVKALDDELRINAAKMLSEAQLAAGPVPEPWSQVDAIDFQTMWALTIIGGLLIAGLFTRLSAVAGAGLLLMFYLAMPPWPGVPEPAGTIEHSFIVNKNLIEVIALLAIAAMPTGQWFGVDAIFGGLRRRGARR